METEQQLKWDRRFLNLAKEFSTWSKDPSTKVGAVIVNELRQIVGHGYNGFPRGVQDLEVRYAVRELKYLFTVHAELNAILHAGHACRGATLYVYPSFGMPPLCGECANAVIQSGINVVVGYKPNEHGLKRGIDWENSLSTAKQKLIEAGVGWRVVE